MKRIIIIDDNKEFLDEVAEALKNNGYRVDSSTTGKEGLELVRENKPDLILLDLKLRNTSGFKVAETLKKNKDTADIPIIAMTGYFSKEDRKYAVSMSGIKKCLTKPFDLDILFEEIEKAIHEEVE
ncbi:MAG: response regulator [Elusimicrobiota bacterium]